MMYVMEHIFPLRDPGGGVNGAGKGIVGKFPRGLGFEEVFFLFFWVVPPV